MSAQKLIEKALRVNDSKIEDQLAHCIKEVVQIPDFYKIPKKTFNNIIKKCEPLEKDTILQLYKGAQEQNESEKMMIILEAECGPIRSQALSIIHQISTFPIIRESLLALSDYQDEINRLKAQNQLLISKIKELEEEDDDMGGFDVDWEHVFNQEKKANEELKKQIAEMENQTRNLNQKIKHITHQFSSEEYLKICSQIDSRKLNIEEIVKEVPSFIYFTYKRIPLICHFAGTGWFDGLRRLIEASKGVEDYIETSDKDGMTPLMYACRNNNLSIVKYLIELGAKVNAASKSGWTPVVYAVHSGSLEIISFLIEKGANINSKDDCAKTPLFWASYINNKNIVNYLIANNADINTRDSTGKTPLIIASEKGHTDIVRILINARANLDITDNIGCTALSYACMGDYYDIVKLLVENGADKYITDKHKNIPAGYAKSSYIRGYLGMQSGYSQNTQAWHARGATSLWIPH